MYSRLLKSLAAVCLLCTFWPVLRFHNITYFDWLSVVTLGLALLYVPDSFGTSIGSFRLAITGLACLCAAGIVSVVSSQDPSEHAMRLLYLVTALVAIVGLAYVLVNRQLLSRDAALFLLCISATINSAFVIMQGQFGLFMNLIYGDRIETWTRMTGLAEHPLESGYASTFGVILALGLAIHTRKWLYCLPALLINLYAIKYSASLTALLGLFVSATATCLIAKSYKPLAIGLPLLVLAGAYAFSIGALGPLTLRIEELLNRGGNYVTLQSRELQLRRSIDMIEPQTLAIGNGYAAIDSPYGDIHNGLVAAVFHFGMLGLLSQFFLIAFFTSRLWHTAPLAAKGMLLGCIIIFLLSYLTGPALSRRSLWVPVIVLGAYLSTVKEARSAISVATLAPRRGLHRSTPLWQRAFEYKKDK